MADIPGIIEGASEGKGLGLRFLRHIERNSLLLITIPIDTEDIRSDFDVLYNELQQYEELLVYKRMVIAITKCDLADEEIIAWRKKELPEGIPACFISAVTGYGIDRLKDLLWEQLNQPLPYDNTEIVYAPIKVDTTEEEPNIATEETLDEPELLDIEWDDDIKADMGLDI